MKEEIPSTFYYEKIMQEIQDLQGNLSAVVVLELPDGGTTYLRYNISREKTAELLKQAYSESNKVKLEDDKDLEQEL